MILKNLFPFQCFTINGLSHVLVNFGVVICPSTESALITFVPEILGNPLKRERDTGFTTNNLLSITSPNTIICLKVFLENISDLINEISSNWDEMVIYGSHDSSNVFKETFDKSLSLDLQRQFFSLFINETQSVQDIDFTDSDFLTYAINCNLNTFINWSPKISRVEIIEFPYTDLLEAELDTNFSLIQNDGNNYYQLVPIAILQDGVLEQIINFDYIFSRPLYWLETLKTPFKNVST